MPTPFELLADPVSLGFFALYALLLGAESLWPARALPEQRLWRLRGALALVLFFFLSSYGALFLGAELAPLTLLDGRGLGTLGGAAAATLLYELFVYVWHRAMHRSNLLFRAFHQMHHSAERVDVSGAFWFSPLDMLGWTLLSTLTLTLVAFTPEAIALFVLLTTFLSVFQHANLRTPRALGFFIQRPESHARHHERGHHRGNFSDLPVFDLLFGTFENPSGFARKAGYYDGASRRVGEMLLGIDVSRSYGPAGGRSATARKRAPQRSEATPVLRRAQLHGAAK